MLQWIKTNHAILEATQGEPVFRPVEGSVAKAKLSLQYTVIVDKSFRCKQNAARMNVVLVDKWITSLIWFVLQQRFRLICEDDLYSSLPEVLPFFRSLPELGVPHRTIIRVPKTRVRSNGSIFG